MKKKNLLHHCLAGMFLLITFLSPAQISEPKVKQSACFFKSKPIRDTKIVLPGIHKEEQREFRNRFYYGDETMKAGVKPADKPVLQKTQGSIKSKGPILNFEGVGNENGILVADPNGEPGLNHYIQTVNSSFAIWDKEGNLLYGPADNKTLWESFPGPWSDLFWGDPVFKYDQLADRWVVSSLAINFSGQGFNYEMVAVSVSNDPLGAYYCYAFEFDLFSDYQKIAIWPDGYYITYNMYDGPDPDAFLYSLVTVINREAMLAGEPEITMIEFEIPDPDTERFFPMAADLRGDNFFVDEPCFIITVDNHNPDNPWDLSLDIYEFQTDWENPGNSQFGISVQFDLGTFEPLVYYGPGASQKGSTSTIMTIPLFLMYPVTYRAFTNHESLVCCHTVWDGNTHYIKWYELRKEDSGWYMYQTGNYAPGEDIHYYFPSITINGNGDMALGYTISGDSIYPSVRLTGRQEEDSSGVMSFQEIELYKGLNYANTFTTMYNQNRWGDYSAMMVDPANDTTFWFTHMYTTATPSYGNWATRVFSFNLSEQTALPFAFAGNDTLTCNTPFFTTQGHAENYSSVIWTTGGDGNFTANNSLNATYLRGPGDLNNGQVTLTMHLTGYEAGMVTADSMILFINKEPEVYAGEDITIDSSGVALLQGEVNFSYEYFWTTNGDGSFTGSTLPDAIYTPGPLDIENEKVVLTLTALEVFPCDGSISDSLMVFISTDGITEQAGKKTLTLFPNPANEYITIQANIKPGENVILIVSDPAGKLLFREEIQTHSATFERKLDFSYKESGIYYIKFRAGGQVVSGKVVLAR